ncbi:MAG: hypothetical protein WBC92_12345 [Terracidiphilus sp.]
MRRLRDLLVGVLLAGCCVAAYGQDAEQIVRQAVKTELAADAADHTHWLYYEVDRKPDVKVKQRVAETGTGDLRRLIAKNGVIVAKAQQRAIMNDFIGDNAAQSKQRTAGQHDDEQASQMLGMLPQAFLWTKVGEQGNETILRFTPNPQFEPPTWEARVFAAMAGQMAVDNSQHRIVSLKGRMIHDVRFWGGLLGDLKAGGSFDVERREIGPGEWAITETHVHIEGHALIFKSISEQEDDVKRSFKELPARVSLASAETMLLAQNG